MGARSLQSAATLRRRVLLSHAFLALVIVLGGMTSVFALKGTTQRSSQTRIADRQLGELTELRAATRELARAARLHVLTGEHNAELEARMHASGLDPLVGRTSVADEPGLRDELRAFRTTMLNLLALDAPDPVTRLERFERELERARDALGARFDAIATRARAKREAGPSAGVLARRAQWSVLVATIVGLLLAGFAARSAVRAISTRPARRDDGPPPSASQPGMRASFRRDPTDAAALLDGAVRARRDLAFQRSVRLRYESALAVSVLADRDRIQRVVDALVELAILETRPGGCLTLEAAQVDAGVRFAITSDQPDATGEHTSAALLAAGREVVEAHGGELDVKNTAAARTYWFTLPCGPTTLL